MPSVNPLLMSSSLLSQACRLPLVLLLLAGPLKGWAQKPDERVEKAVMQVDENPLDTVSEFKGTLGLNLSQTALANWAGGGESSLAFTALGQLEQKV